MIIKDYVASDERTQFVILNKKSNNLQFNWYEFIFVLVIILFLGWYQ